MIDIRKLQLTELGIPIDFDIFCKKNNLKYYLIGGALLGAVRYQKFIPWDDDIDVAMPREDYERLKNVFVSEKYFLKNSETDKNFARCIQKIRLNGTDIREEKCYDIAMHHGIYIDIFPIDYLEKMNNSTKRRARKIRKLMSLRAIKSGHIHGKFYHIKLLLKRALPISVEKIDSKIEELCVMENDGCRKLAVLFLHNYSLEKQCHLTNVFGEGSRVVFEGRDFIGPAKAHEFLRRVFGENYIETPPKEKQKNPHQYISVKF